jgi:hypothetical protein
LAEVCRLDQSSNIQEERAGPLLDAVRGYSIVRPGSVPPSLGALVDDARVDACCDKLLQLAFLEKQETAQYAGIDRATAAGPQLSKSSHSQQQTILIRPVVSTRVSDQPRIQDGPWHRHDPRGFISREASLVLDLS